MKLTKQQRRNHEIAESLLLKDVLTDEDKAFIFEHWHEGSSNEIGHAGAFFTSPTMADNFVFDAIGESYGKYRVLDVCAGIGALSRALLDRYRWKLDIDLVCVEINPEYVRVGKKLVPEATWVCGDIATIIGEGNIGHFDNVISNPPFGNCKSFTPSSTQRYQGRNAHYGIIDLCRGLADFGSFILPSQSAGFIYSDPMGYRRHESSDYKKFVEQTGLKLDEGMGMDTRHMEGFKSTNIHVEFAHVEYPSADEEEQVETDDLENVFTLPVNQKVTVSEPEEWTQKALNF